jgi:hypothetical protein
MTKSYSGGWEIPKAMEAISSSTSPGDPLGVVAQGDAGFPSALRKDEPSDALNTQRQKQPSINGLLVLAGYIAALVLLYGTSLVVPYEFSDSYTVLVEGIQGSLQSFDIEVVSFGRPVYALLANLAFPWMHSIGDLRYLRFIACIGMGLLAWTFYLALRRAGVRHSYALAIPLLIVTIPPYEIWGAWAICCFFPYAAVMASLSALTLDSAIHHHSSRRRWGLAALAIVLLLMSIMIYQPAAMVFFVSAAIFLFCRKLSLKETIIQFLFYCASMVTVIGIDALSAKTLPSMLFGVPGLSQLRTQLATNISDKIGWFFREPLLDALNLWSLVPKSSIAVVVAIFSMVGLFLFLRGKLIERLGKLLIALMLLPLSYLPNLVVAEDWASYRTQAALTGLIALYLGLAILGFLFLFFRFQAEFFKNRQGVFGLSQSVLVTVALLIVVVFGGFVAQRNVSRYVVLPQEVELSYLINQLNSPALLTAKSIYVIPCSWSDSISPVVRYDEFGLASCSNSWTPGAMVYLLLRQYFPAQAGLPITVASSPDTIQPPAGSLVLDMRAIRQYRFANPDYGR